jgi:hypothetical protein
VQGVQGSLEVAGAAGAARHLFPTPKFNLFARYMPARLPAVPAHFLTLQVRIISFGVMLFLPMTIFSLAVLLPVNYTSGGWVEGWAAGWLVGWLISRLDCCMLDAACSYPTSAPFLSPWHDFSRYAHVWAPLSTHPADFYKSSPREEFMMGVIPPPPLRPTCAPRCPSFLLTQISTSPRQGRST